MIERGEPALAAQRKVNASRRAGGPEQLADSLEQLAAALIKEADLLAAANALEEAAGLWAERHLTERQGSCLLLATSSRRVAGDLDGAQKLLTATRSVELPRQIKNGFEVEWCEQELAHGRFKSAWDCFTCLLDVLAGELDALQKAQLYQRRAVAATAAELWLEAAEDLLQASTLFNQQGFHNDAEAAALAAASTLIKTDPVSAERIVTELSGTVPTDGAAATRRGLVGGKIAMQFGNPALALKRFDAARQGALDTLDAVSYLAAAVLASQAAEAMKDNETAYARLATAWVSLSDLLDADTAAKMFRPELEGLRNRIGIDQFASVKHTYEKKRHTQQGFQR